MHTDSSSVARPLLKRTLVQALLVTGVTIVVLSAASFMIARSFLLKRATLHIDTVAQSASDLLERELADVRARAKLVPATRAGDASPENDIIALTPASSVQSETTVTFTIHEHGVGALDVVVPQGQSGSLQVSFDARPFLGRMALLAESSGRSTQILLGKPQGDLLQMIRLAADDGPASILLGPITEQSQYDLALAKALEGKQGTGLSEDYRGRSVIASTKILPSLGWALSVQIDAKEALEGVRILALFHSLLGLGLLLVAASFALLLSKSWTAPVRSLVSRVAPLGPGHWDMKAELTSEDEIALLEKVIVDMAGRLKDLYENLEQLVTDRTQELRKQYELDRAVLSTMEHAVLVTDRDGNLTSMNPAAEQFLGKTLEEVGHAPIASLLPLSDKDTALTDDHHPILRALRQNISVHPAAGTAWMNGSGTEQRAVYLIATPLTVNGNVFGAVAVFQDVTKERQMEQLKSEFITLASHQMRTPLSIVQWQLESLRDPAATTEARDQALTEVEHATSRMTTITNAMLQVAKLEGGALTPTLSDVDLSALLKNTIEGVIDGNLRHLNVHTKLPDTCVVHTDPVLLGSALQNLLENATKYSPEAGNLTIACSQNDTTVSISIIDEGVGIPAQEQRHIFEKFFRGGNVKKLSTDGTGLGLYIAKMIIEELGGSISFESKEGKGTTFTIVLKNS